MAGYVITLTEDDNETFFVTCETLPEVKTFGSDLRDARAHAVDAVEEALAARIAAGEDIPLFDVGSWSEPVVNVAFLPALTTMKVMLYRRLRSTGITRAELARRLGWKRESVDRLFRIDHRSRVEQLEAAMAVLGSRVEVSEVESAA